MTGIRNYDGANVQLGTPLPGAPGSAVGLLTRVDQQVGQGAAGGFDLVFLVATGFDEAPCSCVGHEDLAGLAERCTGSVCHARHLSGSAATARGQAGQVARGVHLGARFLAGPPRPRGARPWARNQLETVVGGPSLRTAARIAACSARVSFSVTSRLRAAAPREGRPIFGFRLRFTLIVLRGLMC